MKKIAPLLFACSLPFTIPQIAHAVPDSPTIVNPNPKFDADAIEFLDSSAKAYAVQSKMSMVFSAYQEFSGEKNALSGTLAFARPDKAKLEFKEGTKNIYQLVADGEKKYVLPYESSFLLGESAIMAVSKKIPSALTIPISFLMIGENPLTVDISKYSDGDVNFSWVSAEKIPDNGVLVKARVGGEAQPFIFRFFFGKSDMLLRRVEAEATINGEKMTNITSVSQIRTNAAVSPDALKFVPAAGVKEELAPPTYSPQLKVGAVAPPVPFGSMQDPSKVVLLDFRSAKSDTYETSLATIKQLNAKYAAKGLQILTVSLDEDIVQADKFFKAQKLTWPVVIDKDKKIAKQYGINYVPQSTFIIGKDGNIAAINPIGLRLEKEIKTALAVRAE